MSLRTLVWAKDQTVITSTVRQKKPPGGGSSQRVESEPSPSATDKLVLIGIGDEASEKTWDALIGNEDLAIFAMTTLRTVRESLDRLERAGYIRVRPCVVESGAAGWNRIYLLSKDSPLVKGLFEVDWSEPEKIERFAMRTFSRRDESAYIPSDSPRAKPKTAAQGTPEPGSAPPVAPRNLVPGRTRNQVPPPPEPGSAPAPEPGSVHLFSSGGASSSIEEPAASGAAETKRGREGENLGPSDQAIALVAELNFGPHRRPARDSEAVELARLVDAAVREGLSLREVRKHAKASLRNVRPPEKGGNAITYLRTALRDRLPIPEPTRSTVEATPVGELVGDDRGVPGDPSESAGWRAARAWRTASTAPDGAVTGEAATG
jgi:hypothetical protein